MSLGNLVRKISQRLPKSLLIAGAATAAFSSLSAEAKEFKAVHVQTGLPVEDVVVEFAGDSLRTGADGIASFPGVNLGELWVRPQQVVHPVPPDHGTPRDTTYNTLQWVEVLDSDPGDELPTRVIPIVPDTLRAWTRELDTFEPMKTWRPRWMCIFQQQQTS
ncbi:hypothetical protein CMO92_03390 [Candidatus Woesearchaeota archaeon]|nr:hypothetical protein [Candidatus Woesearchaeota archaeon]|tara:strand:+ start:60 stop:545 length:486 start_codon:yes stop_codon:yes gene_type:complete